MIRGRFEGARFRAELRLDYGTCDRPGVDFRKLGTIHSHACMSPAHSAIDADDELSEAGLHVTVGYLHRTRPEFAAVFVVGRTRFTLAPADVLSPFHSPRRWPEAWMQRVTLACSGWFGARSAWRRDGE